MKLLFPDMRLMNYKSLSQRVRVLSEQWMQEEMYCPSCGRDKLSKFPNNTKLADFLYAKYGFSSWKDAKDAWGTNWKIVRNSLLGDIALERSKEVVSIRDPHKPSTLIKQKMAESKLSRDKVFVIRRDKLDPIYIVNGGSLSFYENKLRTIDGERVPTELLTDFWGDINFAGMAKEGGVQFKNSKKPEQLVKRVLELATKEGDLVLDSFLGSGTTAAVAHKMGRRWIGVELGDHTVSRVWIKSLTANRAVSPKRSTGTAAAGTNSMNWPPP